MRVTDQHIQRHVAGLSKTMINAGLMRFARTLRACSEHSCSKLFSFQCGLKPQTPFLVPALTG